MKLFARLNAELRETSGAAAKTAVLARYLSDAPAGDAAWAVHILMAGRHGRLLATSRRARERTGIGQLQLSHDARTDHGADGVADDVAAADRAATIRIGRRASVHRASSLPLHVWMEQLLPLRNRPSESVWAALASCPGLNDAERAVWNEIVNGASRVGVSRRIVVRALAAATGVEEGVLTRRLAGSWLPSAEGWRGLVDRDSSDVERSEPYPFCLARELNEPPESLGDVTGWLAEWKWDGARVQLVRRDGRTHIWSRGGELLTGRLPELATAAAALPDGTVLDGQLLAWRDGQPLGVAQLQRRIGRTTVTPGLAAAVPVVLVPYDLLEVDGDDVRGQPLEWRRARLALLLDAVRTPASVAHMRLSPEVDAADWEAVHAAHAASRGRGAAGLMLKRRDGRYVADGESGGWWKWRVRPNVVNAVLVRAHAGQGRRAAVDVDYTFALWDGGWLVPVARAGSGLAEGERRRLRSWIRSHATDDVGPSRAVPHELVFEIAFEAVESSARHDCGLAVRSPRIVRWRSDRQSADADTLDALRKLASSADQP